MFPLRSGPILLLPVVQPHLRFFSPQIPLNSNALLSTSSSLPKSFPIPMENRDDFFCVDPKSLSIEQLNKYKKEIIQLIDIEKNNFERIKNDSNARINAYNQGILLAKENIEGITEEITYEKKLTDEFKKESTSRIEAYQNGIQRANYELSIRKGK
ncbi:unnamed protein product [Rotaria sordida]|uniref:Uncharacterized protein n=1 Tax=Rotaria sordida TaxID=392033 RepID=A0A815B254_9BILA|nr:unnamed protein product [Rotaria sordida]